MNEFTDLTFDDEKSPAQKIAENNAKIAELKARKAELEAKRGQIDPERLEQMRVAANRARAGDASFIHSMYSADADKKNLARKELENAQEDVYLREEKIRAYDRQLKRELEPAERADIEANREFELAALDRLEKKYPEIERHYFDNGPKGPEGGDKVSSLKNKWEGMKNGLTKANKDAFIAELEEFRKLNGNVDGINELINTVKATTTVEDIYENKRKAKEELKKRQNRALDAINAMGKDPKGAKSGDYVGSEVYDAVKNGKVTEFTYNGKTYKLERLKDGTEAWMEAK
jgi:hypothetical protein